MAEKKNVPSNGEGISKLEAVRRAMETLGYEAGRADIRQHVKDEFGIDMTADHVSTYRSDVLRKKASAPEPTTAAQVPSAEEGGISLEDIQAAKELLRRVGTERLKGLIDALAR